MAIIQDQLGNTWKLLVNSTDGSLSLTPAPNNTPGAGAANSITVAALDLIKAALQEIDQLAGGEDVPLEDAAWVLQKLQRLIDRYNARRPMVYNVNFSRFTLPVNHLPITIGPGADFDVVQRPQDIDSIAVILTTPAATEVELLLNKRSQAWWEGNAIKNLTSTLPTDFYYSPDWPNGGIYLWPTPTIANDLRIQMPLVLSEITAYNQSFTMPPAYWDLVVWDLACDIAPSFSRPVTQDMREARARALKAVESNNIKSPIGVSGQPGMPGVGYRGGFNYLTGMPK